MTAYWILFLLPAFAVISGNKKKVAETPGWWLAGVFFAALIGFRFQVGGDWGAYLKHYREVYGISLNAVFDDLRGNDPGYAVVNWFCGVLDWGIFGTNSICALIFMSGLMLFCLDQPNPWLALVVSVPYLIVVVAMGYTRQSVAIGFSMFAFLALSRGEVYKFGFWVFCAALFHKTAVVLLVIGALLTSGGGWWWRMPLMGGLLLLSFKMLMEDNVEHFSRGYINAGYSSSGAAIRIAMNALPAVILLKYAKYFRLTPRAMGVWQLIAWGALAAVPILMVSPSSTAVDRISLYFLPLQVFVWSRVPGLKLWGNEKTGEQLVLVYSAAILFVWLVFAENAGYWLPYRFGLFL